MKYFYLAMGGMDIFTGLLLVFVPTFTQGLIGVELMLDALLLRWVGVFVFGVGCCYWLPFLEPVDAFRQAQFRLCLRATSLVRGCVAMFVTTATVVTWLEPAWLLVALVDGLVVVLQVGIWRRQF